MSYYLAIDIGASSGRHILGSLENGRLVLEEIYRFENVLTECGGATCWDIERLLSEVKCGIARCKELGKIPKSIAIDTWGVDYVLLDGEGKEILPAVSYRDGRTEISAKEVMEIISQDELYSLTGIQKMSFNTIYQLYSDKKSGKLDSAKRFLMIPEYLSYKLTGVMKNEYTNATTTNLVNAVDKTWDKSILDRLGIPTEIFGELSKPTDTVGRFSEEVSGEVGFSSEVVFCPSHDTASAVAACPIGDDAVYISSGTWSLIGTEILSPELSREALEANFTNEGGVEYRYRFLKNVMGMWLFQEIRRNLNKEFSYDSMMQMAMESDFSETLDLCDECFLHPESMIEAVRSYLERPELPLADVLSSVYHSLASSYRNEILKIENITGKKIDTVYIVGGGSRDSYLNRLTAEYTGKRVLTGLVEGTATGNIISQIMKNKRLTLKEAREIVKNTFKTREVNI